jgi:hypothetical protein
LDVQPEPLRPVVELRWATRSKEIGSLARTDLIASIHAAHASIAETVSKGLYRPEAETNFEYRSHFDSYDEWVAYRIAKRYLEGNVAPLSEEDAPLREAVRELLAQEAGEIVEKEQVRALRLRRL